MKFESTQTSQFHFINLQFHAIQSHVPTITGPRPIGGGLDESASHRVFVAIVNLFSNGLRRTAIVIVASALPEDPADLFASPEDESISRNTFKDGAPGLGGPV